MIPQYVKKGDYLTVDNFNSVVRGVRQSDAFLSSGKIPRSVRYYNDEKKIRYTESKCLMPFQLFVETKKCLAFCGCSKYNETYYRIGITNGYVKYNVIDASKFTPIKIGASIAPEVFFSEYNIVYYHPIGEVLHTFSKEPYFYINDWTKAELSSGIKYGESSTSIMRNSVSIGTSHQIRKGGVGTNATIKTVLAFSTEKFEEKCLKGCNGIEKEIKFPPIYYKDCYYDENFDNCARIICARLDMPIGFIDIKTDWWFKHNHLQKTETETEPSETEIVIVSKGSRSYYRGNIDADVFYNYVDAQIGTVMCGEDIVRKTTCDYIPVNIVPTMCIEGCKADYYIESTTAHSRSFVYKFCSRTAKN